MLLVGVAWLTLALVPSLATGQEPKADDLTALVMRLRAVDEHETDLLANRLSNLIRRQEWSDASGKFKTIGSYVGQSEDGSKVMLLLVRGSGENRVEKRVEVPTDKLSSTCRRRVRQLSKLIPKLREKVVAAEEEKREKENESQFGRGSGRESFGGEAFPQQETELTDRDQGNGSRFPEGYDPRRGNITNERESSEPENSPQAEEVRPLRREPGAPVDAPPTPAAQSDTEQPAWRTSLKDFLQVAGGSPQRGGAEAALSRMGPFGQQIVAHWRQADGLLETPPPGAARELDDLIGEVRWEVEVLATPRGPGDIVQVTLPEDAPPAELLELSLIVDPERRGGNYAAVQPGDRVQIVGRPGNSGPAPRVELYVRFVSSDSETEPETTSTAAEAEIDLGPNQSGPVYPLHGQP